MYCIYTFCFIINHELSPLIFFSALLQERTLFKLKFELKYTALAASTTLTWIWFVFPIIVINENNNLYELELYLKTNIYILYTSLSFIKMCLCKNKNSNTHNLIERSSQSLSYTCKINKPNVITKTSIVS